MSKDEQNTVSGTSARAGGKPVTFIDKIVGIVFAFVLIGLCEGTWIEPDLISNGAVDISGDAGRVIVQILEIIWWRPTGTIAGIIGLFVAWGAITRKIGELPGR